MYHAFRTIKSKVPQFNMILNYRYAKNSLFKNIVILA